MRLGTYKDGRKRTSGITLDEEAAVLDLIRGQATLRQVAEAMKYPSVSSVYATYKAVTMRWLTVGNGRLDIDEKYQEIKRRLEEEVNG